MYSPVHTQMAMAAVQPTITGQSLEFNEVAAPGACTAALGTGAGNLSNGAYKYKITFLNALGETVLGTVSNTVTVVAFGTNGKINLTAIPISPDTSVTSRKIYRTKADGSTYYYLAELADNTTTTYADNIADGSITVVATDVGTTSGLITTDGRLRMTDVGGAGYPLIGDGVAKVTAAAPYTNDGYIVVKINGTSYKLMTVA